MQSTARKIKLLNFTWNYQTKSFDSKVFKAYLNSDSVDSLVLMIKTTSEKIFQNVPLYNYSFLAVAPDMTRVVLEIQSAFTKGIYPIVNMGGTSEAYLLKDSEGLPLAIFKPENSSLGGCDARKEIAAYRLDYDHFAKVPPTVMASFSHPYFKGEVKNRQGSCQWFVEGGRTILHVNSKKIAIVPSCCVRRLAILDVRLINPDRHTSNILYRDENNCIELIPIDHGSILPESLFGACYAWLSWDQAKTPFDQDELDYIAHLDPLKDAQILLNEFQICIGSVENMIASTYLLKEASIRGWDCFEIGKAMTRELVHQGDGKRRWNFSFLETTMKSLPQQTSELNIEQYCYFTQKHIQQCLDQKSDIHMEDYAKIN